MTPLPCFQNFNVRVLASLGIECKSRLLIIDLVGELRGDDRPLPTAPPIIFKNFFLHKRLRKELFSYLIFQHVIFFIKRFLVPIVQNFLYFRFRVIPGYARCFSK
jgi:hypothetical protein